MSFGGYRSMWIVAMFDLPVDTKAARFEYRRFVKALLMDGFDRMQFSVYVRFCASEENAAVHRKHIAVNVPPDGEVRVLQITDKQFERIQVYCGRLRPPSRTLQLDREEAGDPTGENNPRRKKYLRKPITPPDQISFF